MKHHLHVSSHREDFSLHSLIIMKFFVAALFLSVAAAAPQGQQEQQDVQVLRYDNSVGVEGYNFAYELSDGTKREEQGQLRNVGTEAEALAVQGSYTWVAPDGVSWIVTFIADENGFQPKVESRGGISGGVVASLLG